MEHSNKSSRRYLRYHDSEREPIVIVKKGEAPDDEIIRYALVIDESRDSMACVYVGTEKFIEGEPLFWKEANKIYTPISVIRSTEINEEVNLLVFKF